MAKQTPDHSPEFSRRCAAVVNSQAYYDNFQGNSYEEKQQKRDAFREALTNAADYNSLPPDVKAIFDKAEASMKG